MAYEQVEGFLGPRRADYQAALVASVVANVNRDPNKKALSVEDFLPEWDSQPQSPEDQRQMFDALTGLGGDS